MIRRDAPAIGGKPATWVLISQIEHAHLAGRLAEHWGAAPFEPLVPKAELLWAIYHHDDGWRDWDQSPDIEPKRGAPRAFTEMEIDDSVSIWARSIAVAAEAGPLEGYVVAGHFRALARRGAAWRKADPAWPRAQAFIDRNERQMLVWLEAWQAEDPRTNTKAVADLALSQLQFFDSLSLWFCCAAATDPDTVPTPKGPELTLSPLEPGRFCLNPWPLDVARMNLEVAALVVPVASFHRGEALTAPLQPAKLHFQLVATVSSVGQAKA